MTRALLFMLLLPVIFSCRNSENLPKELNGEWVEYDPKIRIYEGGTVDRRFGSIKPEAFLVLSDSLEFYNGIFAKDGQINERPANHYCGNFAAYKYSHDSIYIKACQLRTWIFYAKVEKVTADSLILLYPNSALGKKLFLRSKPPKISTEQFDEIIFSHNYWSTANRIAISRTGEVWLSISPDIVTHLRLSHKKTDYIFSKFTYDLPEASNISYGLDAIDGSRTYIIFVKNGKIVKTIIDENEGAPDRLFWAYTPVKGLLLNNYKPLKPSERLPGLVFTDLEFRTEDSVMELNGAEIFHLWKELYKAPKTTRNFAPHYRLTSAWGYSLLQNIPGNELLKVMIDSAETDGRFFKFYLANSKNITYDLSYDFVKKNLANHRYELETYQQYLELSKPINYDSLPK